MGESRSSPSAFTGLVGGDGLRPGGLPEEVVQPGRAGGDRAVLRHLLPAVAHPVQDRGGLWERQATTTQPPPPL